MKRMAMTMVMSAAAMGPAQGQSLLDTFHQLRSTASQLAGKARPAVAAPAATMAGAAAPAAGAAGKQTDGEAMVPASVLVDDASDTALEQTIATPRRIATFDIRDLRLGMSPREFGRIAGRQGFRRRWNSMFLTSGTFEVEAAQLANMQLNRPIHRSAATQLKAVQGFDPSGDELNAEFMLEPSGPKLSKITYIAKLNGMTPQQAADALRRKYGSVMGVQYSPDDVLEWTNGSTSPALRAVIDSGRMTLTLQQSLDYMQASSRRLHERAQQLAAAGGGGVRF